ncbi:MAG: hypothetical protein ACTJH9_11295 [Pseudoalteromonas sp.]|uniref:hypothetical protein n=1 Tax=unclassified Pseudoalteromonas TaxID=194690 RepID=UPI003F97B84B
MCAFRQDSAVIIGTSDATKSALAATMNLRIKKTTSRTMLVMYNIDKDQDD